MSINLVEICRLKYPGQVEAFNITFSQPENDILIIDWNVEGVPKPSEADLLAESALWEPIYELNALKNASRIIIQNLLDKTAHEKEYKDALHCVSYASSANIIWKAEADLFITWRDDLYEAALSILDGIQNNNDPVPTEEEFLSALPAFSWP